MVELFEVIGDPLADAFIVVGVLVALMLALMAWARGRWGRSWDRWLVSHAKSGPAVAAVLSLPPGCSGVIATVTLYGQRRVTYGTVIAALLSTMGDSAWILLAADPVLALELKAVFVIVGAVGGYMVDALRIDPRARVWSRAEGAEHIHADDVTTRSLQSDTYGSLRHSAVQVAVPLAPPADRLNYSSSPPVSGPPQGMWDRLEPCCIAPATSEPAVKNDRYGVLVVLFWLAVGLGALFAVPSEFGGLDEEAFPSVFGVSSLMVVGVAGFVVSVFVALQGRMHQRNCHCVDQASRTVILRHTAYRASIMITLVGVVSLLVAIVTEVTGFDVETLPFVGVVGVLVAALLGLLPSCGLEVVMASLFVSGALPLAALIAYLISHDGAGLLPLFAVHRRSAVVSTVLTTIPALAIGLLVLVVG